MSHHYHVRLCVINNLHYAGVERQNKGGILKEVGASSFKTSISMQGTFTDGRNRLNEQMFDVRASSRGFRTPVLPFGYCGQYP